MNTNHENGDRIARAVSEVESLLERTARFYPDDLPADHYARLTAWKPELHHRADRGFTRYLPEETGRLEPLRRQLEVARTHAEALLVSERLDEAIFGPQQREELTQRALGILPTTEAGRFREVIACPELRPRVIARSAVGLLSALEQIERECGRATAVAYGMLTLAGLRHEEEFEKYGTRLDRVFLRLVSAPPVIQALDQPMPEDPDQRFEVLFRVLVAVHDQIWLQKSSRVSFEFLLTQVIDNTLGGNAATGNSLGLALLDSIILGKLGFPVNFLVEDGIMRLEVLVASRSVYWETTEPHPLSFVPVVTGQVVDTKELFALAYGSLATMCFSRNMWDRAIEAYEHTLELKPISVQTRTSLGACYLRKQQPAEALKALKAALDLEPASAETLHQLGNAHAMMSSWSKAIDCYKKAVRIRPDMAEVYNNLGFAYMHSDNPSQAVAAFECAIEHRPEYYQAHFNLANLHMEQQQYELAIRHYRETVRLEPKYVPAYYNMGRAHYEKHDLDGAVHCYQKAVTLNPKHFGAWHNLGIAYRDKGQTQKAVEALEKAVTINPNLMR
jgi:tetratricopeptide (TPR) repeat protein